MLQTLYDGFLASMLATVNAITGQMAAALAGPISVAATIYIIGYGLFLMRGGPTGGALDFAIQALKLGIVVTLVSNVGQYNTWIGGTILTAIPDFISSLTAGPGATAPWDGVIARAGAVAEEIKSQYGSFNLAGQIFAAVMSFVLYCFAIGFASVATVVTLIANFGLALMAALGPLFVAFALFEFTRGWFFSWLGQVVNFAILQLLVTILAIFTTAFIGDVFTTVDGIEATQAVIYMAIGLMICTIFFFLLPGIAAALSAGAQASTGAAQRVVERAMFRRGGGGGGGGGGGSGRASRA